MDLGLKWLRRLLSVYLVPVKPNYNIILWFRLFCLVLNIKWDILVNSVYLSIDTLFY